MYVILICVKVLRVRGVDYMQLTIENAKSFKREFMQMCEQRAEKLRDNRRFSIENLPLLPGMSDIVLNKKEDMVEINNVTEEYFKELNGTCVYVYPDKTEYLRPRVGSDGKVLHDKSGAVIVKKFEVPQGSLLVATTKKVVIPNTTQQNKGFQYATMGTSKKPDGTVIKQYYYTIPKENLYSLNYCALVLSSNPRRANSYYYSIRVLLQNGCAVYLSVMPISKIAKSQEQRIIYKALKCDMQREIRQLLNMWAKCPALVYPNRFKIAYAFPQELTYIQYADGVMNLSEKVISNAMNTLDSTMYIPRETLSLAETARAVALEEAVW